MSTIAIHDQEQQIEPSQFYATCNVCFDGSMSSMWLANGKEKALLLVPKERLRNIMIDTKSN